MEITTFLIYGLAVWRVSSLLVREDGPFLALRTLRALVGIGHDEDGVPYLIPDGFLPQMFGCTWCMSIWISLFFTIFYIVFPVAALHIAMIFAFSTIAVLIETYIGNKK